MECPICQTVITEGEVSLKCSHKLCVPCFVQWARKANTCPCCRDEFSELPKPLEKKNLTGEIASDIVSSVFDSLKGEDYFIKRIEHIEKYPRVKDRAQLLESYAQEVSGKIGNKLSEWYER